jgi:hypothetical protein
MKQASVGLNYLVCKHTCPIITVHHLCVGLSHRAKHTVYKNEPKISYTQPGLTIEGLFGSGDIPKWLGVATEKVVAKRLV